MIWPNKVFAYNVAQASIRVAAREVRVARRHAPDAVRPEIDSVLEGLAALDEALGLALEDDDPRDALEGTPGDLTPPGDEP